jgi:hypothetical protein
MPLRVRDIEATIDDVIAPLLDTLAAGIGARECDLVLINGPLAALPVFERGLRQRLAMAPWRLINMHQRAFALLEAPMSAGRAGPRAWLTGSVGAWLASRREVTGEQFSLLTGNVPADGVVTHGEPGRRLQLVAPAADQRAADPSPAAAPQRPSARVP